MARNERPCRGARLQRADGRGARPAGRWCYLPAARRCQRVRLSIFLCFFLRIRLRRFLISEPMRPATLVGPPGPLQPGRTLAIRPPTVTVERPSGVVQSAEQQPLELCVAGSSPAPRADRVAGRVTRPPVSGQARVLTGLPRRFQDSRRGRNWRPRWAARGSPRRATPGCSPSGERTGCTSHRYSDEQTHRGNDQPRLATGPPETT
jgi:hypothetical protein